MNRCVDLSGTWKGSSLLTFVAVNNNYVLAKTFRPPAAPSHLTRHIIQYSISISTVKWQERYGGQNLGLNRVQRPDRCGVPRAGDDRDAQQEPQQGELWLVDMRSRDQMLTSDWSRCSRTTSSRRRWTSRCTGRRRRFASNNSRPRIMISMQSECG